MTCAQDHTRQMWRQLHKVNPDDFSWYILAYHQPSQLIDKHGEPQYESQRFTEYSFPSPTAAIRFIYDYEPGLWFYDLCVLKEKAHCPAKYLALI